MAFDAVRGRLILFGGSRGGLLNDTWLYDIRPGVWQSGTLQGASPSPRSRLETAYVSDRGTTLFFGGLTAAGLSNELWMLGPGFISAGPELARESVVNAFSNIGGTVAPG